MVLNENVRSGHRRTDIDEPRQSRDRQERQERQERQDGRRPGLHGRARIWGPTRSIRMILLSTALMGLQFTWSVEMAYGTPFLLQLGLSKSLMSLVWIAGPLSGLIMQPIVGVLSDRCTSKLGRRRPFLIIGVIAVVVSFLCLGWCREIIRGVFGSDYSNLENATILMAVGSIYILDFAINCVQASCRTLIVDSLPASQQEAAASWASRLMGIGGILGYFMGNVNLPQRIPAFGDTQIKGLCVIACLFLIFAVGLTCVTVTERVMVRAESKSSNSSFEEFLLGFKTIFKAIRYLPTRIQHLCNVQFFAWMGWFPFLFYSSTYIAEIYTREMMENGAPIDPNPPSNADQDVVNGVQDAAIRAGSYCLLIYSIISLAASILLPVFVAPAEQVGSELSNGPFPNTRSENGHLSTKRTSKWNRIKLPQWLQLPIRGLTLPRMYTLSLVLVSFSLISTWYIHDLRGSTILFAGCGISWAVTMWAPFSILGEVISQQMQEEQHQNRVHESNQSQSRESTEVLFQKQNDDDDDSGGEEIQMVDSSRGRQYQPLRGGRESLDEVITVVESNFQGGRHSSTSSPTIVDGLSSIVAAPAGWTVPPDQGVAMALIDPTDSDTDVAGDDHDGHLNVRKHREDEGRTLVRKQSSRSQSSTGSSSSREGLQERRGSNGYTRSIDNNSDNSNNNANHPALPSSRSNSASRSASASGPPSEVSSAGALLGIHNVYIVLPQFLVSFLSSLVFAAIEPKEGDANTGTGEGSDQPGDPETIGVMLRIGGIMAGIAALLSLKLWKQPRTVAPLNHL